MAKGKAAAGPSSVEGSSKGVVASDVERPDGSSGLVQGANADGGEQTEGDGTVEESAPVGPSIHGLLRNHTGFLFDEPVTGKTLHAGGTAAVTLHNEEHLNKFTQSLERIRRHLLADEFAISFERT